MNGQIAVVKEAFNGDFVNSLFNAFLARIVLKGKFPFSAILSLLLISCEWKNHTVFEYVKVYHLGHQTSSLLMATFYIVGDVGRF